MSKSYEKHLNNWVNKEKLAVNLLNSVGTLMYDKGIEIVLQFAATTSGSNVILNKPYVHVTDNAVMNSYLLSFKLFYSAT